MSEAPEVVIYSTSFCGYCMRARSLLERKGIAFREVKVDQDPRAREEMLTKSRGRRTVPQIFIGERHVGGYDELYALEKSGDLAKLVGHA